MEIYQHGKTLTLNSTTPRFSVPDLKRRISLATGIPADLQRLLTGTRQIGDDSSVSADGARFPAVTVALRLRGRKGGFGSLLLRGAGSKAWQKKTSNFDACRDMSGRRLRHVNAERRLEDWRASAEERTLELKAEEFLKKAAKKGKKGVGDGETHKYVAKYREESDRCVSEVMDSVKAAVEKGGKRKKAVPMRSDSKAAKSYYLFDGYAHLFSGLDCGLAGLSAGMAIGIVGDAGVRVVDAIAQAAPPLLPRDDPSGTAAAAPQRTIGALIDSLPSTPGAASRHHRAKFRGPGDAHLRTSLCSRILIFSCPARVMSRCTQPRRKPL